MPGPTYYCWRCYASLPELTPACPRCGGPTEPPPGTSGLQLRRWALGHPLIERRMVALEALSNEPAAAGDGEVIEAIRGLLDDADPYLAAQALRAFHALAPDHGRAVVERAARTGAAPVRHTARQLLREGAG